MGSFRRGREDVGWRTDCYKVCFRSPPTHLQLKIDQQLLLQVQIKDLVAQYAILFPKQVSPTQSTEEIDKAANEYFQHIFTAEPH